MAFDNYVMAACLSEITDAACGAKINKIHQPGKHQLLLRFYGKGGQGRLLLSAEAQAARLHLTAAAFANPRQAPLFLMVARKWLEGALLQKVEQTPFERIATLGFLTKNEVGDPITVRLIVEAMGKHSNIILVDEAGKIIDGIRRYDSRLSRYREVLPQRPYIPPPPLEKALPLFQEEDELAEALMQTGWQGSLVKALPHCVAGISPWLAKELLFRAGIEESLLLEEVGAYELSSLLKQMQILSASCKNADFAPTLLLDMGRPIDFAAFSPGLWQGRSQRSFVKMSEALDMYYTARREEEDFIRFQRLLQKNLHKQISRLQRKIAAQQEELALSERGESYKLCGDLLAAHLYTLREQAGQSGRGLAKVHVPSFDDPENLICVELDAALTLERNIQRYYGKYNKCRKANTAISSRLNTSEEELAYLQSIAQSISAACLMAELTEIELELISAKILPPPAPVKGKKPPQVAPASLPPRRYQSADGFTILIGRNNKQNDRLSLRTAAPDDIWLHAQKIPGSHVIIVSGGQAAPDTTLTEAAAYAAWFSQAREAGKVAVDYTQAAQVKKPSGAKPGMVNYFQQRTVYVKPRQPVESAVFSRINSNQE
ncbi:MAG: NFACT family protein [Clostridiales bacterium]|nr:NFACT family protein [Clostridiales bacterium]